MTIERQDFYIEYEIAQGDAERTEFPFSFPVKEATHIFCYDFPSDDDREGVEAIPRSDYAVNPASTGLGGGGAISLAEPLDVGHILRIERSTDMTQEKVFRNQDRIPPEEVEDGLDRLTMIAQEQRGKVVEFDGSVSMAGANAAAALNAASQAAADAAASNATANQALAKAEEALEAAEGAGGGSGDYDLPVASATVLGGVKVGSNLSITPDGTLNAAGGGGEGGTTDHRALSNRDAADSHPQSAVTGLVGELAGKAAASDVAALAATVSGKANASDVTSALEGKAPLASPALTGTPTVNGSAFGSLAYIDDAPSDGKQYARQSSTWVETVAGGNTTRRIIALSQTITAEKTGWMWLYLTGGGGGGGSSSLYAAGGGGGATVPCLVSVNAGDSIAITIGAGGSLGAGGGQTAVTINGVTYTAGGGGGGGNSTASLWGGGGGGGGISGTGGAASGTNGGSGGLMDNGGSGSGTYAGAPGGGGFNCGGGVQHVNRGGTNGAGGWAMNMHGTSAKYGFGGNGYATGNPGCVVLVY